MKYTDHYAIKVILKNIPTKSIGKKTVVDEPIIWNTNRKEGWDKYRRKTEQNSGLDNAVESSKDDVEGMMSKISKEINNVKYACFGKVKKSTKFIKETKAVETIQRRKANTKSEEEAAQIDEELCRALQNLNSKKFDDELKAKCKKIERKGTSYI